MITVFISLYSTRLILEALGTDDFGIYSVVAGSVAMLLFLNTTMSSSTQRFMSYAQGEGGINKQRGIFNVSTVLHFFIGIAIVIILEIVGLFLFDGALNINPDRIKAAKFIYQFMLVSTFFTVISVPYDATLNAHEDMFIVAILGIIDALFRLAIAISITWLLSGDKLIWYGLLMAVLSVLLMLIRRVYCHHKYAEVVIDVKQYFDKTLFHEMKSFAGWSLLGSIMSIVTNQGKTIMVNIFFGSTVNAAQGISNQVVGQVGAFSNVLLKALNPVIVKSEGEGNRKALHTSSMTGSKLSFYLFLIFAIPVIIEMPFIFNLWLVNVPQYAIEFCRITIIIVTLGQLSITLTVAIGASGNIKNFQIVKSSVAIIPFITALFFFHLGYPPVSLYYVYLVSEFVSAAIILYYANKTCEIPIRYYIKEVYIRSLLVAAITFSLSIIPTFIMPHGLLRLGIIVVINISSFLTFIAIVGLSQMERVFMKNVFAQIKQFIKTKFNH
jgi:O-antigen/teichoic acid export membrane protein